MTTQPGNIRVKNVVIDAPPRHIFMLMRELICVSACIMVQYIWTLLSQRKIFFFSRWRPQETSIHLRSMRKSIHAEVLFKRACTVTFTWEIWDGRTVEKERISEELPFPCNKCHKEFSSSRKLRIHAKAMHSSQLEKILNFANLFFVLYLIWFVFRGWQEHFQMRNLREEIFHCLSSQISWETASRLDFLITIKLKSGINIFMLLVNYAFWTPVTIGNVFIWHCHLWFRH